MKKICTSALGSLLLLPSMLHATGQVLPDEMVIPVGDVENVGADVTLVLTKRSMRADNCRVVLWTDDGFSDMDIPSRTVSLNTSARFMCSTRTEGSGGTRPKRWSMR